MCKLKITKSTAGLECDTQPLKGGYIVQPNPAPVSTYIDNKKIKRAGGNNQKLRLFNLGKAISGAPIIVGTSQFPKPPIKTGITKKKIIIIPCEVRETL